MMRNRLVENILLPVGDWVQFFERQTQDRARIRIRGYWRANFRRVCLNGWISRSLAHGSNWWPEVIRGADHEKREGERERERASRSSMLSIRFLQIGSLHNSLTTFGILTITLFHGWFNVPSICKNMLPYLRRQTFYCDRIRTHWLHAIHKTVILIWQEGLESTYIRCEYVYITNVEKSSLFLADPE